MAKDDFVRPEEQSTVPIGLVSWMSILEHRIDACIMLKELVKKSGLRLRVGFALKKIWWRSLGPAFLSIMARAAKPDVVALYSVRFLSHLQYQTFRQPLRNFPWWFDIGCVLRTFMEPQFFKGFFCWIVTFSATKLAFSERSQNLRFCAGRTFCERSQNIMWTTYFVLLTFLEYSRNPLFQQNRMFHEHSCNIPGTTYFTKNVLGERFKNAPEIAGFVHIPPKVNVPLTSRKLLNDI